MADGLAVTTGGADDRVVFERAARLAWGLVQPLPLWSLAIADALVQAVPGDDVVLPHNPWAAHQTLTALEQGGAWQTDTVWGRFSKSADPRRNVPFLAAGGGSASAAAGKGGPSGGTKGAGGPGGPGGPGRPGGASPPGGGGPPDEKAVVELWLTALELDRDLRVRALGFTEQRALALIASRNKGHALGLVQNRVLPNLNLPGVRGTDQLALVLTLYDRLDRAGVINNSAYFSNGINLLSDKEYELAGVIQEMAYIAAAAENAAVNGYHTHASEYSDVPRRILQEELEFLPDRFPRVSELTMRRITERAQIDGYVIGDRLVEVKLRGRGKVVYSQADARDDETYVSEQFQALKLLAIAKRDGLRGVEFALFGTAVDGRWVEMVRRASAKIGIGAQIVLYPPSGDVQEVLNTMPAMGRRPEPIAVEQSPIRPPKVERRYSSREIEWGMVDFAAVRHMLSFVTEARTRAQAEGSPRNFHKHVRSVHARQIMVGFQRAIEGHFRRMGELTPPQEALRERWRRSWGELNGIVSRTGDTLGVENAKRMAMMAYGILQLTKFDEDAQRRLVEARNRFLRNAQVAFSLAAAQFRSLVDSLPRTPYLLAPSFLGQLDAVREVVLMERFRALAAAEGVTDFADLSLADVPAVIEGWATEAGIDATAPTIARDVRNFSNTWRSMIDRHIPEAMARWRQQIAAAGAQLPPAEPFPRDVAREFLARFEAISSRGGGGGKPRDPRLPPPGDWAEAVGLLGLGGDGMTPPLGREVMAAVTLLPDGIHLYPAEIDRIKFALNGIELFHVEGREEGSVYYYLPQVYTAATRMIRQVLMTAYLRHRAGTTLGVGRQLVFPWVMTGGMRGQQPFWLEVSPGGRPDQLVLDRIVVVGESQIPPRVVEELLRGGIRLALPQGGGGTRTVHFDLVQPVQQTVAVDSFSAPREAEIEDLVKIILDASFRDRYPGGDLIVPGKSRFQPVEEGYLTVPEIMEMKLQDAYLRRVQEAGEGSEEEPPPASDAGEEGGAESRQRFFTVGRIRDWTDYVEQQLQMQRLQGVPDVKSSSYYFLRVRTSHRGAVRVLLHLRRITDDFGEHLRLRRIPGFALATEIAARGQTDVYDVPWTHSRLTALYRDIDEKVPEAERTRYIRRFRSMAGGGRYSDLKPGQIALNLRELRRSRWGIYFRLRRNPGQLLRQEMIDRGITPRTIELLRTFVQRHVPAEYRDVYLQQIRGNRSPYEVLINVRQLARSYADQMDGAILGEIQRVLPPEPSRAVRLARLGEQIEADAERLWAIPEGMRPGLLPKQERVMDMLLEVRGDMRLSLAQLERIAREFREDVDRLEQAYMQSLSRSSEKKRGPGGEGGSGASSPPSGAPPSGSATPTPTTASAHSGTGFAGMVFASPYGASDSTPPPAESDWSSTDVVPGDASLLEGGQYFLDGAFPPVSVPRPGASPVMH